MVANEDGPPAKFKVGSGFPMGLNPSDSQSSLHQLCLWVTCLCSDRMPDHGSFPFWIIWNLEGPAILGSYVVWSNAASSTSIS